MSFIAQRQAISGEGLAGTPGPRSLSECEGKRVLSAALGGRLPALARDGFGNPTGNERAGVRDRSFPGLLDRGGADRPALRSPLVVDTDFTGVRVGYQRLGDDEHRDANEQE